MAKRRDRVADKREGEAERRIEEARRTAALDLDLSVLSLRGLPDSIWQLTQLHSLDVSSNELASLPESIEQLTQLRSLDVSLNKLTSLPKAVGRLARLERLCIYSNQLKSVPESIRELRWLSGLHVSENPLGKLPDWIGGLSELKYLSAASAGLSEVPDNLCGLPKLQLLSLGDNPLRGLSEAFGKLASLRGLHLGTTEGLLLAWEDRYSFWNGAAPGRLGVLESLPAGMRNLHDLLELYLHGQPRLDLPPEVLGPTWWDLHGPRRKVAVPVKPDTILDYYFRTHGRGVESRPLNEAKMILVGRGGVGKTSLVNRLVHGRYNPTETKTDGISITQWPVDVRGDQVKLNIWDFGGQEIMHATHQFFLTKRSLYLLVLNAREGEQDGNIDYWLRLIESFGGDSPVLVAINKVSDHPFDLNRRGLKEKFPAIREFIQTDCEAEIGLDQLHAVILRETDRLEHLRDPFPAGWMTVKEKLAHLRQYEDRDFIPFARYQALCAEHGVLEAVGQETLVGFLHDLGIVVNFRDDPRLAEMHVLNPEWVTNGIYKILNAETLARKQGELRLADLPSVLDANLYPRRMHLFLLDLMRKFELCYEFYESVGHYLVPELLGKEEPDLSDFGADALRFNYCYNILPEGLLPRFIVRSRVLNKEQPRWRTGVVLSWEGNTAVVKADPQDRNVSVAVVGPANGRRRLLAVIRADLEHIHRSIAKLQAVEEVPVPGFPGLAVEYETLRVMEDSGERELKLAHNGKVVAVNIAELLGGVDEVRGRAAAAGVGATVGTSGARDAVRVAFSYSHKDEELRDQLETHLKLLQRSGFISSWHDRRIMPGDNWKDQIDDNFKQADLILLLVSADFIASDYCYDVEMKMALKRESSGDARVAPVILRACEWREAPFGKLQALPKDGKGVTSWGNRDEAWNDVATGIRRAVEELRQRRR